MEKKNLPGIILFTWFYLLLALGSLAGIITLKNKLTAYPGIYPSSYYYVAQSYNVIGLIAYLAAAVGLLKLLKWARVFTMAITTLFFFIGNTLNYLLYARPYLIPYCIKINKPVSLIHSSYIMGYLWFLVIIYYFTRPKVKEQFR